MTVKDLEGLYDYGYWANKKLLAVVSQLTPEQFTQTVAGSYGSVRNTLVHVLSAEWGWLDRCGGHERGPALEADDYPNVESLAFVRRRPARRECVVISKHRSRPNIGLEASRATVVARACRRLATL
jgi:uncharacterized damage-inducible protein DinB